MQDLKSVGPDVEARRQDSATAISPCPQQQPMAAALAHSAGLLGRLDESFAASLAELSELSEPTMPFGTFQRLSARPGLHREQAAAPDADAAELSPRQIVARECPEIHVSPTQSLGTAAVRPQPHITAYHGDATDRDDSVLLFNQHYTGTASRAAGQQCTATSPRSNPAQLLPLSPSLAHYFANYSSPRHERQPSTSRPTHSFHAAQPQRTTPRPVTGAHFRSFVSAPFLAPMQYRGELQSSEKVDEQDRLVVERLKPRPSAFGSRVHGAVMHHTTYNLFALRCVVPHYTT